MRSTNESVKLYVGDLGDNRKSDLNRLFSKYGEISTIYIDENKHFGFVEFKSLNDAKRALERTNNKTINGSKIRVEYAKSDKISRNYRRPLSRDRSPTSILYSHLQQRGPRTPPLSSTHRSSKRTRSGSNAVASTSERKSSSSSSSEDEEKRSSSRKSPNDESNRKHSKRKTRE
ncbi:unnamed protein product [Adineta steineri]|uniref:RRM domain-containing protein n=1 Tax=Adineta steineri TaxID=433720 RepID=A0A819GN75_9BILA|nr:unnamed protein product [Adineta steineri]